MSRKPLNPEIDWVHKYIEYCLMHHMTKKGAVDCIANQANIKPDLIQITWEQLEAENKEFFRAFYTRLAVRDQIVTFNHLLSIQAQLMPQQKGNHVFPRHSNASQQQALMHQLHNADNGLQHRSTSQQQALMHQQHNADNGLQHRSNASQQQALMHQQHNADNGLQYHSNVSQQQELMHQYDGLIHHYNATQQQAMMHQHNVLVHHSNASQQQVLMHQHNVDDGSHVSTLQVSTPNAGREDMLSSSSTLSTLSYLHGNGPLPQGMDEKFSERYIDSPTSHFSSSSIFPESNCLMGDQAEYRAQNPLHEFLVDLEEDELCILSRLSV